MALCFTAYIWSQCRQVSRDGMVIWAVCQYESEGCRGAAGSVFHSTLKYVHTSFIAGISEWVELNGMGIHDGFEVACRSGTLLIGD